MKSFAVLALAVTIFACAITVNGWSTELPDSPSPTTSTTASPTTSTPETPPQNTGDHSGATQGDHADHTTEHVHPVESTTSSGVTNVPTWSIAAVVAVAASFRLMV